ncbi:MAG: hypothetical protein WA916_04075 [Arcobacter sp.]|uniref:hypothetical protein n=1 Tax=Arcobacter sp. TaxID=1872629 RepID=UPI003C71E7C2
MDKFDVAISIGFNCQSRYHISRIMFNRNKKQTTNNFKCNENHNLDYDYGTFLWDWQVNPLSTIINVLNNEFENVFNLGNLEIIEKGEFQCVLDKATGSLHYHTFSKQSTKNLTYDDLKKEFPKIKEKSDYLVQKTYSVIKSNKKILFVLTGCHKLSDIKLLVESLEKYTINFKILYTPWKNHSLYSHYNSYDILKNNTKIILHPIRYEKYPGCSKDWDEAFQNIEFNKG